MSRREVDMRPAEQDRVPSLPMDTDADGFPLIHRMKARIGDLEHRLDYLLRTYDPDKPGQGKARIRGEIWGLQAALIVMRYYEMEVGGEDSVITALEALVAAHDSKADSRNREALLRSALEKARGVLQELHT